MKNHYYFDMDGTLNQLFKLPNWQHRLNNLYDATVYYDAPPRRRWPEIKQKIKKLQEKELSLGVPTAPNMTQNGLCIAKFKS